MNELKIDEELKNLLPPLTKEEYDRLEESIVNNGCRDAICVWHGYIADGHNRYSICKKHNINFNVIELGYETKDEVMEWMIKDVQLARRNLSDIQKVMIVEKYRKIYEKIAKENISKGGSNKSKEGLSNSTNLINKIDVRKKLAEMADMGTEKYFRTKKIIDSGNQKIIDKINNKEMTVNKAYTTLFKPEPKKKVTQTKKICEKCNKELDILDFYEGHSICKECENEIEEERINKNRQKNKEKEDKEFDEILKDIKTPKDITKSSIDSNISCIKETSDDFIENLNSTLFVMEKLIDKINKDNVNILLDLLEEHIDKIKDIENQINEKVGK